MTIMRCSRRPWRKPSTRSPRPRPARCRRKRSSPADRRRARTPPVLKEGFPRTGGNPRGLALGQRDVVSLDGLPAVRLGAGGRLLQVPGNDRVQGGENVPRRTAAGLRDGFLHLRLQNELPTFTFGHGILL